MPGHRPQVLDEQKRDKIIALLSAGCSRRMAARHVGCAPNTIKHTAVRDPEFARQVAQAETSCQIFALQCVRNAANDGRYWRAAAWLLERTAPEDFGNPGSRELSERQLKQLTTRLKQMLQEDDPLAEHADFFRELDARREDAFKTLSMSRLKRAIQETESELLKPNSKAPKPR